MGLAVMHAVHDMGSKGFLQPLTALPTRRSYSNGRHVLQYQVHVYSKERC